MRKHRGHSRSPSGNGSWMLSKYNRSIWASAWGEIKSFDKFRAWAVDARSNEVIVGVKSFWDPLRREFRPFIKLPFPLGWTVSSNRGRFLVNVWDEIGKIFEIWVSKICRGDSSWAVDGRDRDKCKIPSDNSSKFGEKGSSQWAIRRRVKESIS